MLHRYLDQIPVMSFESNTIKYVAVVRVYLMMFNFVEASHIDDFLKVLQLN